MGRRVVIVAAVAAALGACSDAATLPASAPSLRGTITALAAYGSDASSPGEAGPVHTVVVQPGGSYWSPGGLGRCYRDAVLSISDRTRVRLPDGERVGPGALAVGQPVSVWTERTFPVTLSCRPGQVAADILIESTAP